jgi:probable phosphoglycerate mutase
MGRRLTVEADGGSRGNPGIAGYGALVRDTETGALLAERAEPLGTASNNVAEYRGLIAGLTAARAVDAGADVEVAMDSKLVVEQMSGRWKIKHQDMRRLALQAREIATAITDAGGSVTYRWMPREQNRAADALSNVAMDGRTVDRVLGGEPAVDEIPPPGGEGSQVAPQAADATGADRLSGPRPRRSGDVARIGGRGTPTRVVLVRHGVTEYTSTGRLDGRGGADPSLSAVGRAQARAAGAAVAAFLENAEAAVVTSSLARARETGALVASAIGARPSVDADWDEQGFGDWDGVCVRDLLQDHREDFVRFREDPAYARPGGESHEALAARVLPAFDQVVQAGGSTVVVCHRKPIMVVLAQLLGMPHDKAWRLAAGPGSLSAVEVWPGGEVSVAFTNRV